jgi:hypothetical protein
MLKRLLALVTLAAVMAACGASGTAAPTVGTNGGGLETSPIQSELPLESPAS